MRLHNEPKVTETIVKVGADTKGFTVFHRTGGSLSPSEISANISSMISVGFKPGKGDMYGRGLYATLNMQSQMNRSMESSYGDGLVEYFVSKQGFLIFDYTIAKLVYPGDYTLVRQLLTNGIFKNVKDIPLGMKTLSEDLFSTLQNPLLSADRAYHIWRKCYDPPGTQLTPADMVKYLKQPIVDRQKKPLEDRYEMSKAVELRRPISSFPSVNGIVYTGENDGNVIVVYKPSPALVKPVKWCVLIPGNTPSDVERKTLQFAVPWQPVGAGKTFIVTSLLGGLADAGAITTKKTIAGIDQTAAKITAADMIKKAPWIKNNASVFQKLYISILPGQKIAIVAGIWKNGTCTADYFGLDETAFSAPVDLKKQEIKEAVFMGGIFAGGLFKNGIFSGGRFESGEFAGGWVGGTWAQNGKTKWAPTAKFIKPEEGGFNKRILQKARFESFIIYEGQTYPLDRPPPEWVVAFKKGLFGPKANAGDDNSVEDPDTVLANLSKMVKIKPTPVITIDNPGKLPKNTSKALGWFKKDFPWLFKNVAMLKPIKNAPLEVAIEKDKLVLYNAVTVAGNFQFDKYDKSVIVMGGTISGKNFFEGVLDGGNYTDGVFNGEWRKGALFLDKIDIGPSVNVEFKYNRANDNAYLVVKDQYILFDVQWLTAFNNDPTYILKELKKDFKKTMSKIKHHMDQFDLLGKGTKGVDTTGAVNYSDNDPDED
jgi:hypothetical protein